MKTELFSKLERAKCKTNGSAVQLTSANERLKSNFFKIAPNKQKYKQNYFKNANCKCLSSKTRASDFPWCTFFSESINTNAKKSIKTIKDKKKKG